METVLRYLLLAFVMSVSFSCMVCTLPGEYFRTDFIAGNFLFIFCKSSWGYVLAALTFKSLYFDHVFNKDRKHQVVGILLSMFVCSMIIFISSLFGYFTNSSGYYLRLFIAVIVNMYLGHILINSMYYIPESE